METEFKDCSPENESDFFLVQEDPLGDDDTDEEEEIIRDGNDEVLREMEAGRKKGDYAPSQTSRSKKAPTLDLDLVDWSGFSAAAHQSNSQVAEKKHRVTGRRISLQHSRGEQERLQLRAQRRLSSYDSTYTPLATQDLPVPTSTLSPKIYRNRRYKAKVDATREFDVSAHGGELPERKQSDKSGRDRSMRARRCGQNGRSKSRSKSRTRKGTTRNRSASPTSNLRSSNPSSQPSTSLSNRIRRPPAPAAPSSKLEVGGRGTPRSISLKRRSSPRATDSSIFQKATSLKW